jgi:hypothetical protein
MLYKNLDGTTSEEFSLGKGLNKVWFRTNGGIVQYKNYGGEWTGFRGAYATVVNTSSNHSFGEEDSVNFDTSGGYLTGTLPASPTTGKSYKVSNRGNGDVTISGNGKTINGDTSKIIKHRYSSMSLEYNGTEWVIQ